MSTLSLARLDLARLAGSKRWIAVAVVWLAIGLLSHAQLAIRSQQTGLAANVWDLRFVAVNNWMYVSYMLLLAFVFLVGDSVTADRSTGWSAACITRTSGLGTWWAGKVTFVLVAALVYQLGFLAFTLVFGFARGLPLALAPSDLGLGPVTPGALFAPLAAGQPLAVRLLVSLAHETLGFAAICLMLIAVCSRSKRPSAPVALAVVFVVVDWIFAQRITLWELLSPGRRLLESVHLSVAGIDGGVTWMSTFVYLAVLLVAAIAIGRAATRGLEF